jgi:hypothetical protein
MYLTLIDSTTEIPQPLTSFADEMWIPRVWTGEPGFIGGVGVVKKKRRRGRKWTMVSGW